MSDNPYGNDKHCPTCECEGYSGWSNWETWCVALWLNNDQATYNETIATLKVAYAYEFEREEALRDFVLELIDEGRITDDISIHRVNWREVMESFKEEMENE